MAKKTAILVDGSFFLKRYRSINKIKRLDPQRTAKYLWEMCLKHLKQAKGEVYDLYRIFYYDCLPYDKKQHNPVTGKAVDFSKRTIINFRYNFWKN
ncbi:MAG TPA: NYN domain-containing protein [Bacteroidetes bacterium]|nr:NYN domain-containing protein [Bacteroidota bacterium]